MTKYNLGTGIDRTLFKPVILKFERRGVFSPHPNAVFSIDLVDMHTKPDGNYKYILNCVDVYSRKVYSVAMESKNIASIKSALMECFSGLNKPNRIWADMESALISREMKTYLEKLGITVYHTYGIGGSCIVERYNRTLKEAMVKSGMVSKWATFAKKFQDIYNATIHSSIKCTPNDAYKQNNKDLAMINNIENYTRKRSEPKKEYDVGDKVRVSLIKRTFEKKSMTENWSREIFKIHEVMETNPTTFKLIDEKNEIIKGTFYKQEIQKV